MRTVLLVIVALLFAVSAHAADGCPVSVGPSPDYRFLVASQTEGTPSARQVRWMRNGSAWRESENPQTLLLHFDGTLASAEAVQPASEGSARFVQGRFGQAMVLSGSGGSVSYARTPAMNLDEGSLELWVSSREDGTSATYTKDNELFRYGPTTGDWLGVRQAGRDGTLYLGGTVRGQWQSAYSARASMRAWRAGEWHHLAATWSASGNTMRFYIDGVLAADSNEHQYVPPAATTATFSIGSPYFVIDEARMSSRALTAEEVRGRAARAEAPRHGEVWLDASALEAGDSILAVLDGCTSAAVAWTGVPILDVRPQSTILPQGTTAVDVSLRTVSGAECRWDVGESSGVFTAASGGQEHTTRIEGLDPEPSVVNLVKVRCSNAPDYTLELKYRSLGAFRARYPRIGNLWGSGNMLAKGHEYASHIDGYFGAEFSPADIRRLRELHPQILILTSINTVENKGVPEGYFLHDTRGNKIEVWPGTYRLNLTKPHVAEYQAKYAWQKMLDSGLLYDGVFFDNFFTTQAWLKADIHGTAVELDADEDGRPDDPVWLDREWRKGVFQELALWRQWMPYAPATGHLPRPPAQDIGDIFNGGSILFATTDVIEGKETFQRLWDSYMGWWAIGQRPGIASIESSPANQLSYGYGYNILRDTPASTQEFARTQFRYMRFGLAVALMQDGYYWFDYGDILHGIDWWYDEYDFDLGFPVGAASRVTPVGAAASVADELLRNGDMEDTLSGTWQLSVTSTAGAAATVERSTDAAQGQYSALISIRNAGAGTDWHIDFNQRDRSLKAGTNYSLQFRAKADAVRDIALSSQKGSPDWRNYGLTGRVTLGTEWQAYSVTFAANETVSDSRIQFFLGAKTGRVWLDEISLKETPPSVYSRDFTHGRVLLNGTASEVEVEVPGGFRRFRGEQAPGWQYQVDDADAGFSATGNWKAAVFDTGQWKSKGPFYHHWWKGCRTLDGRDGEARWDLGIREDGRYRIETWWASPPEQNTWTREAVYEVVAGGRVVATATLDQTKPGDRWYLIAEVELTAAEAPFVRVRNAGSGKLIADALSVSSSARLNDGSAVERVRVGPFDGVLLQRIEPIQ